MGEGPPRADQVREDDRPFRRLGEAWAEAGGFLTRFAPWNTPVAIMRAAHVVGRLVSNQTKRRSRNGWALKDEIFTKYPVSPPSPLVALEMPASWSVLEHEPF